MRNNIPVMTRPLITNPSYDFLDINLYQGSCCTTIFNDSNQRWLILWQYLHLLHIYCCYYLPIFPQRVSGVRRWRPGWRQWQWGTCPRCRTASRSPWTPWRQYLHYLRCTQWEPISLWTVKAFLELQLWPMHTSYLFHLDNHMLCPAGGLEGTHSKTVPNPCLFYFNCWWQKCLDI